MRYLTFSLVCGRIWQQGAPAGSPAVRVVGRWSPVATSHGTGLSCRFGRCWTLPTGEQHPSRQARQVRPPIFTLLWGSCPPFFKSILGFLIRLHPPPTAATLSSTRNAPGFAFFGLNRVRFPLFLCFSGAKFSDWLLCILPHSGYKLKPSVIPCRREVSFLT